MTDKEWFERPGHEYRGGTFEIGGIPASELAEKFGTPLYVTDANRILYNFHRMKDIFEKKSKEHGTGKETRIDPSLKGHTDLAIAQLLRRNGCEYVDVTSPYEGMVAKEAGFDPTNIMFTGTSVSNQTLRQVLDMGLFMNIDSGSQLRRLNEIFPYEMDVAIRWNPGIGAGKYPDIITAGKESEGRPIKFGIEAGKVLYIAELAESYGKNVCGLHQHIGSGWNGAAVDDFLSTVDETLAAAGRLRDKVGRLRFIDFGGGPGIRYKADEKEFPWEHYFDGICCKVKQSGQDFQAIEVEPSRSIFGDAGILLLQVNTVEKKNGNLIIGVDGGFNVLARPKLYKAYHEFIPCERTGRYGEATVAGPLCETGDILTVEEKDGKVLYKRMMEIPKEGSYIAALCAGAYGFEMGSNYNKWPLPARVMVYDGIAHLIGRRQTYDDLRKLEVSLDQLDI
ncbi:MAG: diaminopimelate decarboxylase [Candidatus Aenigmarchaeota archaeon]|nr:diaminopimelate decarboxylase [Candidatus Aenigmarchaeota archaeon]